jgi:hypothetical protein
LLISKKEKVWEIVTVTELKEKRWLNKIRLSWMGSWNRELCCSKHSKIWIKYVV